jgi:hypothetical protein
MIMNGEQASISNGTIAINFKSLPFARRETSVMIADNPAEISEYESRLIHIREVPDSNNFQISYSYKVRFQVLTAASMKMAVFWVVGP